MPALLPPPADPVDRAHWYLIAQDHRPCPPGRGCHACAKVWDAMVEGWQREYPWEKADPVEREARQYLDLWYGMASTVIDIRFSGVAMYDPARVPASPFEPEARS